MPGNPHATAPSAVVRSVLLCLASLACPLSARAQPSIRAVFTADPPKMDGRTDDAAWAFAEAATEMRQFEPVYGNPPTERTEVRVLYDNSHLYVGFDAYTDKTRTVAGSSTQRDSPFFSDDYVGVYLDTFYDRRNAYGFFVNALGTQRDLRIVNEGLGQEMRRGGDSSWDCAWTAKTARLDGRWSAELAIPFAELRFDPHGDVWGVNFARNVEAVDEELTWADVGTRQYNVSQFGTLMGLDIARLDRGQRLLLAPYGTISPRRETGRDLTWTPKTGLDLRYPMTSLTLDFTLNPDFAQIEADPSQVNLTDVELRLQEKRPFFLEGGDLYRTPIEVFYTRRVEDLKLGAKMAGRIGPQDIAFMSAQAAPLAADALQAEGTSNFSAVRYQREVWTGVGLGLLGVSKVTPRLERVNGAAGVDLTARLARDVNVVGHYVTNWDRNYAPERAGWQGDRALLLGVAKRTNTLRTELRYGDIGPDFHADAGFIPRTDRRGYAAEVSYRRQFERPLVKRIGSGLNFERLTDSNGRLTNERLGLDGNIGFRDLFFFGGPQRYFHVTDEGESSTDETVELFIGWFPPKHAGARIMQNYGVRDGMRRYFVSPNLTVRPTERWSVEYSEQREMERSRSAGRWRTTHRVRRVQSRYQFSQYSFLTGSFEDTREGEQRFFILYGTEYLPRSFLFVVYSARQYEEEGRRLTDRAMFVKLSYQAKMW